MELRIILQNHRAFMNFAIGLQFPIKCGCGAVTPGWERYETHLASELSKEHDNVQNPII